MFPQFVTKVKVRGIRFNTLSAGAIDGGVCPTDLAGKHLIDGTFADLTDLLFALTAEADGATRKVEAVSADSAIAATTNFFTLTPLDMALMVNRNPVKTLNLFPFNGGRWLACYIKDYTINPANLVGYACGNPFKHLVGHA